MTSFADLPTEITDIVLRDATQGDHVSLLVLPFVCHLWKALVKAALLPVVQQNGFGKRITFESARVGWLGVLKWARENGAPWDWSTCSNAAHGGYLEVLKWARENGAPWDVDTCTHAAKGGHLEVLQWARENGALWNLKTCSNAAEGGH